MTTLDDAPPGLLSVQCERDGKLVTISEELDSDAHHALLDYLAERYDMKYVQYVAHPETGAEAVLLTNEVPR